MDPNANINEQWEIVARIDAHEATQADYARLHELKMSYGAWRASGGFAADRCAPQQAKGPSATYCG